MILIENRLIIYVDSNPCTIMHTFNALNGAYLVSCMVKTKL